MTPERRLRILIEDATKARELEQTSHLQYAAAKNIYDFAKKEWKRLELLSIQATHELQEFQRKHPDVKPEILV